MHTDKAQETNLRLSAFTCVQAADLINLGFEHRLHELYKQFEAGKISLGKFAAELGLGVRDLYEALEQRNLPTSNIVSKPVNVNG